MDFAGDFETHLTVAIEEEATDRVSAWAAQRGLKFSQILLDRGSHASQPMVTSTGHGLFAEQMEKARTLQRDLATCGFEVTRVKVEAAPWNEGVPLEDSNAAAAGNQRYFEHHLKLLLPADADLDRLASIAEPHGAHLSRNARRHRSDGMQERFVTQRCYRTGRATAQAKLEKLAAALKADRWNILEIEQEYVVYDSNLALDDGWIEGI
jgi:hypothetical protein